jgi:hypothetical protein
MAQHSPPDLHGAHSRYRSDRRGRLFSDGIVGNPIGIPDKEKAPVY